MDKSKLVEDLESTRLRAHHGELIVFCEEKGTPEQPCWGRSRWHGPSSDGSVLCEGHYAMANGDGYKPEPKKLSTPNKVYLQRYTVEVLQEGFGGTPPPAYSLSTLGEEVEGGGGFLVSFKLEEQTELTPEKVEGYGAGDFFEVGEEEETEG